MFDTSVRFTSPVVDYLLTAKVVIQTFSSLPCLHGNHYWKDHWQVIRKDIFLVEIKIKSSQFINMMSPFFVNEYIGTCFTESANCLAQLFALVGLHCYM